MIKIMAKNLAAVLLWLVTGFVVVLCINEFEIFGTRLWGVRRSDARRQVYEQSQSYVEGKRQELMKYHHSWVNSTPAEKESIEFVIRHSFANFDESKIENRELRKFLIEVKMK